MSALKHAFKLLQSALMCP